jgi:hypothetical protein
MRYIQMEKWGIKFKKAQKNSEKNKDGLKEAVPGPPLRTIS